MLILMMLHGSSLSIYFYCMLFSCITMVMEFLNVQKVGLESYGYVMGMTRIIHVLYGDDPMVIWIDKDGYNPSGKNDPLATRM